MIGAKLFLRVRVARYNTLNSFKGDLMKKLFVIACTLVLGGVMSFAQAQNPPASTEPGKAETGKKKHHHHKAGKKSKKGADAGASTTK
jgi:hypothetical protein